MTTTQIHTRTQMYLRRRTALALLAALTLTLGAGAVPLARTAEAGGKPGGVVGSRAHAPPPVTIDQAGGKGGVTGGDVRSTVRNPPEDDEQVAARVRGAGSAPRNQRDLAGSKPGASGGSGVSV